MCEDCEVQPAIINSSKLYKYTALLQAHQIKPKKSLGSGPKSPGQMRRASERAILLLIFFLLKLMHMNVKLTRENDDVTTGRG